MGRNYRVRLDFFLTFLILILFVVLRHQLFYSVEEKREHEREERELRERERERYFPHADSCHKSLQHLGQAKAKSWELNLSLPPGHQELITWNCQLLPPRVRTGGSWNWERSWSETLTWESKQCLTC